MKYAEWKRSVRQRFRIWIPGQIVGSKKKRQKMLKLKNIFFLLVYTNIFLTMFYSSYTCRRISFIHNTRMDREKGNVPNKYVGGWRLLGTHSGERISINQTPADHCPIMYFEVKIVTVGNWPSAQQLILLVYKLKTFEHAIKSWDEVKIPILNRDHILKEAFHWDNNVKRRTPHINRNEINLLLGTCKILPSLDISQFSVAHIHRMFVLSICLSILFKTWILDWY